MNFLRSKNNQLFAKRRQFPDQLVVLDAVDGEERAPIKLRVLLAQFLFLLSFMMPLGLVQGFCGDIIFGIVADPEEYGLQWIAFDERHPDDVLETFVEIAIIFLVMTCGQRDELVQAVEGETEQLARIFGSSDEIPTTVILLKQIGENHRRTVCFRRIKLVEMQLHHLFLRDGSEQLTQQTLSFQRILGERHNLATCLHFETFPEPFQTLKVRQTVKLSKEGEGFAKQMFLVIRKLLREDGERWIRITMATFLDRLEGSWTYIVNLIMLYFSDKRAFVFQIMKVEFNGAAAYMLFPFLQLFVDQTAQILGRIVVVTVGQQLVENVVACYSVFVCGHNVSIFRLQKYE